MTPPRKPFFPPLLARDRDESGRTATPLELFFDLVVVIALDSAAHGLVHAMGEGQLGIGLVRFFIPFFAIWWAWNLFTWFASCFDNDDAAYRIKTMIVMMGLLLMAADIPLVFRGAAPTFGLVGYMIVRLTLVLMWLRVISGNPDFGETAVRYRWRTLAVLSLWAIVIFGLPPGSMAFRLGFLIAAICDMLIPWFVEKSATTPLPWHREHIVERFGLLNIIVLGEVLLSSTRALEAAIVDDIVFDELSGALIALAICGVVIAFSMWWLYFCQAEPLESVEVNRAFAWTYGHFFVFAAGSLLGAGLELMVETLAAQEEAVESISPELAGLAISLPLALYILGIWFVRDRYHLSPKQNAPLLFFAVLIGLSGFSPYSPVPATLLLVICLAVRLLMPGRELAK